tara:strand:- start:338 stop:511 length:174 start_codon:yes stop_codon:yes gene_type:complete
MLPKAYDPKDTEDRIYKMCVVKGKPTVFLSRALLSLKGVAPAKASFRFTTFLFFTSS